jgi:hypothetical protein
MNMNGVQLVGLWYAPKVDGEFGDNLNLGTLGKGQSTFDEIVSLNRKQLGALTSKLDVDADEACAGGVAHRFEYSATFGTQSLSLVQLLRIEGDTQYIVTYTRTAKHPADPAALAAIRSLCGPSPSNDIQPAPVATHSPAPA